MFPLLTVLLAVSLYVVFDKSCSLKEVLVVELSIQTGICLLCVRHALWAEEVCQVIGDIFTKKFR